MRRKLKIINKLGLHARASSKFVEVTNKYKYEIFIEFNDIKVNAKSILGLLSLAISFNDEFEIFVEGEDEDKALNERDYGELTGLNKDEARENFGIEQVQVWRRSYDTPPPGGESLKDTYNRVIPYFESEILPFCLLYTSPSPRD